MTSPDRAASPAPRRALITGGAGFVGSHLAEALIARGDRVTVIDDLSAGRRANLHGLLQHPRLDFVHASVTDEAVLDRLMGECDLVFHLAAVVGVQRVVSDPIAVLETNILGTRAVLQAAARRSTKVLLASTSEVYGKTARVPLREDDDRLLGPTQRSRWSYATSKAVDEFLGLAYHRQIGLPVVIFRLFNTIGPRQSGRYGMVVPRFVEQALRGEALTVFGDGRQTRCFCDVRDVVRALLGLAEAADVMGQVFNVGTRAEISILDLARKVLTLAAGTDAAGDPRRIAFVPYDEAYEEGFEEVARRVPDIGKVRAAIGWEPRIPLDDTLAQVIESLRSTLHV